MQPNIVSVLSVVISITIWVNADAGFHHTHHPHRAPETRIINGQPVKRHSVPYIVAITTRNPLTHKKAGCGGILISDSHILTAGHCVYRKNATMAQFGAHNRSTFFDDPGKIIIYGEGNFRQIVHENYNPRTLSHDIAIIKLVTPLDVNHTEYVEIARLPEERDANKTYLNETVQAYGWGNVNDNPVEHAKELMGVNLTVLDFPTCYQQLQKAGYPYHRELYTFEICTNGHGPNGPTGICHGDSGSPLVYNGTVIGLASRLANGTCTREDPSIFVSVGQHLDWIRDKVKNF